MINCSKTHAVQFSLRVPRVVYDVIQTLHFEIPFVDHTKLLGIVMDSRCRWTEHIDFLCGKLRTSCFSLKFMKNFCSNNVLRTIYYASVHCHLRYGVLNWGCATDVGRVFILQKYAIRIIAGIPFRESCRPAFKELKILTLVGIYILEICIYVYKNKSFFINYSNHCYNTRGKFLLAPKNHNTAYFQKNLQFMGCKIFNMLPVEIQNAPNIFIFKKRVKSLLLDKNCYYISEFFE